MIVFGLLLLIIVGGSLALVAATIAVVFPKTKRALLTTGAILAVAPWALLIGVVGLSAVLDIMDTIVRNPGNTRVYFLMLTSPVALLWIGWQALLARGETKSTSQS